MKKCIFYIKSDGKLRKVHEHFLPDTTMAFKMLGTIELTKEKGGLVEKDIIKAPILFKRITGLDMLDEGMFIFDYDSESK